MTARLVRLVQRRYGRPPRRGAAWRPSAQEAIDIGLTALDGAHIRGWFLPTTRSSSRAPAAVLVHGWGGSAQDMAPLAEPLLGAGMHVLLLDARSHGRSDDAAITSMPAIADDLQVGLGWIRARSDVDASKLVLVGHSVGAGACLLVASREPGVVAVVAIASMAHPRQFMRRLLEYRLPLPIARLALRFVEDAVGQPFDGFAPVNTIRDIGERVLIVHGDQDMTVPLQDAHALHAASGGAAELLVVRDAGHVSIEMVGEVGRRMVEFLEDRLARRPRVGSDALE